MEVTTNTTVVLAEIISFIKELAAAEDVSPEWVIEKAKDLKRDLEYLSLIESE